MSGNTADPRTLMRLVYTVGPEKSSYGSAVQRRRKRKDLQKMTGHSIARSGSSNHLPQTRESCARSLNNAYMVNYRLECLQTISLPEKKSEFSIDTLGKTRYNPINL